MKFIAGLLVFVCGALWGYLCGWTYAHHTVSVECDRLGGFYVVDRVFVCERKQ
ncbi:MAG: hypothetical protein K0Q92_619 [Steroidobacteraceae bacterium]|jgi:hypothetical protein|nr:hypothetical protein [Steroidobacteraceae bacterium]